MASIWLDGAVVDSEAARVSGLAHTLHYGLGVFEGIRAYAASHGGGAIFRLEDHLRRLERSAHVCGLELGFDRNTLATACTEVLHANGLRDGYLRPIAYQDDGNLSGLGASPPVHVSISAHPWGAYLGEDGLTKGIRAVISSYRRAGMASGLGLAKICGQYVASVLAKRGALAEGYDEALLMDEQGYVAEGTGENLFLVEDSTLITPPASAAILPGITRDTVLRLAHELGQVSDIREDLISRDRLLLADEVFLTGTAAEVTPVAVVGQHTIGKGVRGPITAALQTAFFAMVRGERPAPDGWLWRFPVPAPQP